MYIYMYNNLCLVLTFIIYGGSLSLSHFSLEKKSILCSLFIIGELIFF